MLCNQASLMCSMEKQSSIEVGASFSVSYASLNPCKFAEIARTEEAVREGWS